MEPWSLDLIFPSNSKVCNLHRRGATSGRNYRPEEGPYTRRMLKAQQVNVTKNLLTRSRKCDVGRHRLWTRSSELIYNVYLGYGLPNIYVPKLVAVERLNARFSSVMASCVMDLMTPTSLATVLACS